MGWQKKILTAVDLERRLGKALKDLATLKTICDDGKILELPYVKSLLQNTADDGSFQNFNFNDVQKAKITNGNNTVIWTDKVIRCVENRFKDDSHKDIMQVA